MIYRTLKTALLFAIVCGTANAGMIIQPSAGQTIAPGNTVVFDLIIKNETPDQGSSTGGDLIYTFDSIGPLEFSPFPAASGISFTNLGGPTAGASEGIAAETGWNPFDLTGTNFFRPFPITLLPEDATVPSPGQQHKFGTVSIDIAPTVAVGTTITFELEQDLQLGNSGVNATSDPPALNGTPSWVADPNPPFAEGIGSQPGFSATFAVAVPEPSPVLLLGLLAMVVGGRRYVPKLRKV